jgi:hypothetical protein
VANVEGNFFRSCVTFNGSPACYLGLWIDQWSILLVRPFYDNLDPRFSLEVSSLLIGGVEIMQMALLCSDPSCYSASRVLSLMGEFSVKNIFTSSSRQGGAMWFQNPCPYFPSWSRVNKSPDRWLQTSSKPSRNRKTVLINDWRLRCDQEWRWKCFLVNAVVMPFTLSSKTQMFMQIQTLQKHIQGTWLAVSKRATPTQSSPKLGPTQK